MGLEDLTADEQLTYWVGAVAREVTNLESRLRMLYRTLIGFDHPALVLFPSEIRRAVEMCSALIRVIPKAPDWLAVESKGALDSVLNANAERNRFIHDLLIPSPDAEATWMRLKSGTLARPALSFDEVNLDSLRRCRTDLVIAGWRVQGVKDCVGIVIERSDYLIGDGPGIAANRRIARGEFTLWDDGRGISY